MYSPQIAILEQKLKELAKKAHLSHTPELCISKNERLASVNVFQQRILVGQYLLRLWNEGKLSDADVEATLAHEIGHLMDLSHESKSANFRNLIFASIWCIFGTFPFVLYIISPSSIVLVFSILFAVGWGFSLPRILRRIDVKVELEADKNAALYLVEPNQLATALAKINALRKSNKPFGFKSQFVSFISIITHPTFTERINHLNSLNRASDAPSL